MADQFLLQQFRETLSEIENNLTDGITSFSPWITPIPSAVLVANATVQDLHWSPALEWVAAGIIENLGLTTVSTSLLLWDYNTSKRKTDPNAPFFLAASLVGVYLISTIGLTVLLDIFPVLARYALALYPVLALVGAVNLALLSGHRRRLMSISQERAERKADRQVNRPSIGALSDQLRLNRMSNSAKPDNSLDKAPQTRKIIQDSHLDSFLTLYLDNPNMSVTEEARTLNMSRQMVYSFLDCLEKNGHIRRNEHGVEIMGGQVK